MPNPVPSAPEEAGLRELRELQQFMAGALFRPLAAGDHMQPSWTDGSPMRKIAARWIKPNDRLTAFERLEIYNRVYWYRVLDSLYEDFPAVRGILGVRKFMRMANAYVAAHPSESYTLRDLGRLLPEFLQREPALSAPHTELAVQAARFEWAEVLAFDSEARPPLSVDSLLGADPLVLRIALQPYITLLRLDYPIDDFILRLKKSENVKSSASNTASAPAERAAAPRIRRPARLVEPICVAVHRYENSLYYKRLDPAAYAILEVFSRAGTLAEACEAGAAAASASDDFASSIQRWFHDWSALNWLCERAKQDAASVPSAQSFPLTASSAE